MSLIKINKRQKIHSRNECHLANAIRKTNGYFQIKSSDVEAWKIETKADEEFHDTLATAVRMETTKPENVAGWNMTHLNHHEMSCFGVLQLKF